MLHPYHPLWFLFGGIPQKEEYCCHPFCFFMRLLTASDEELKKKFFALKDFDGIADLLELTPDRLKKHLYMTKVETRYTRFQLKKKTGGFRNIYSPNGNLKLIQSKLSYILYLVYNPRIAAKGFVQNESIVTNARMHVKKKAILNIDIENFFESINFGRVYGLFLKKPFSFDKKVAAVIAHIACINNILPQGSPSSPILTNMICYGMDLEFQRLAQKYSLVYTRYADDITFSTTFEKFPEDIAKGKLSIVEIGEPISHVLGKHGFKINNKKSRIQYGYHRQLVTGLVVNKGVNVQRRYLRNLRGIIHSIEKHGYANAEAVFQSKYSKQTLSVKAVPTLLHFLRGKLSFLAQVKGNDSSTYISLVRYLRKLIPGEFDYPLTKLEELKEKFSELKSLKRKGKRITKSVRGFEFEALLRELFEYFQIEIRKSFKRIGDEQVDGAISLENWHYLIECKWKKTVDTRQVDALKSLVDRSGSQTSGIFISINGWSKNVITNLQRNNVKNILLMNGEDIEEVLAGNVSLNNMLKYKIHRMNLDAEPYTKWAPI
jgi:RNA-directed DNA polymerase